MTEQHFSRWVAPVLSECCRVSPAVFLNGPRQAGKSTLVRELAEEPFGAEYVSFDDVTVRAAAENDPSAFLRNFKGPVIIDEVQLVPDLFRSIKIVIDELRHADRKSANGRFILTGSANILALPALSDALVGRMRILTLLPLAMGEFVNAKPVIHDLLTDGLGIFPSEKQFPVFDLDEWVPRATFPEIALNASNEGYAEDWYQDYITTILQRDVRNLAEIDKLSSMPNLLKVLALRMASLVNDASAAREVGLNAMTYRRYRALLQHVFLIAMVPPWFRNIGKRLTKSPKLFFYDTGLLAHLLGVTPLSLKTSQSPLFGHLVENFVATELMKQMTLSRRDMLYHYRADDGKEVDFVIESPNGKVTAIEVKTKQSVTADDFSGLRSLKSAIGKDFKQGLVLYSGGAAVPFGSDLMAVPISSLIGAL